jgi:hypothetical protein
MLTWAPFFLLPQPGKKREENRRKEGEGEAAEKKETNRGAFALDATVCVGQVRGRGGGGKNRRRKSSRPYP